MLQKLLFSLILISAVFAASCVDDGVCADSEDDSCADCSFGASVCVNDGICTLPETKGDCQDCSLAPVSSPPSCVNDGVCSDSEEPLGFCSDCNVPATGFLMIVGGGVLGFFGLIVVVVIIVAAVFYAHRRGYLSKLSGGSSEAKRIRM